MKNKELTALEALKSLRCAVSLGLGSQYEEMNNKCDIIEKALKALEIIKNKHLYWDINYQPYEECGHYRAWDNELYESVELTKEEYDLLKEVLK